MRSVAGKPPTRPPEARASLPGARRGHACVDDRNDAARRAEAAA